MPAVAGIGIIIIALCALLILYGTQMFAQAVAGLIWKIPYIGKYIANAFLTVVGEILDFLIQLCAGSIRAVIGLFSATFKSFTQIFTSAYDAIQKTAFIVGHITGVWLPQILREAKTYALNLVRAAEKYALNLYDKARSYALGLYDKVRAYALSLYHAAEAYALKEVKAARAYALSLYHMLQADILNGVNKAEAYARAIATATVAPIAKELTALESKIASELTTAEAYAAEQAANALSAATTATTAAVGALATDIDQEAAAIAAAVWPGVIDTVNGLEGVIGTDLPDIGAAVRAIPLAIPTTLAGVLAGVEAISIPALRYMEECGIPNCKNLSKIGRDLQDLFSLIEGASFLTLLVEAVDDPIGTAHAINGFLSPIVDPVVSGTRDLLGV